MKLKTALQCTQESNNGCMGNGVTGISQLWSAWLCSLNSITFECLLKGKYEFCYLSPQQKLSDRTSLAVLETLTCSSAFLWATRYEQMYCRPESECSGTAGPLGNTKATSEPRHISCSYPVYWLSFLSWHIQLNINPLVYLDGTLTVRDREHFAVFLSWMRDSKKYRNRFWPNSLLWPFMSNKALLLFPTK